MFGRCSLYLLCSALQASLIASSSAITERPRRRVTWVVKNAIVYTHRHHQWKRRFTHSVYVLCFCADPLLVSGVYWNIRKQRILQQRSWSTAKHASCVYRMSLKNTSDENCNFSRNTVNIFLENYKKNYLQGLCFLQVYRILIICSRIWSWKERFFLLCKWPKPVLLSILFLK